MIRLKSLLQEQSVETFMFGDRGPGVKKMQQRLMQLGYSVGHKEDDGWFGRLTKRGIETFQKTNRLPVTGEMDVNTAKVLNSPNAEKALTKIQIQQPSAEPEVELAPARPLIVTSNYGYRKLGKLGNRMHKGTDYAAATGTQIKILQPGRIEIADMNRDPDGWGALVQIKHPDGSITRYAHLSKISVQSGDAITAGTVIGETGGAPGDPGAGRSTGAHLHWEYIAPGSRKQSDGSDLAKTYFAFV